MRYATNVMQRLRHYRGHGIHSPFVYSLVHEVFMAKKLQNSANPIYNSLMERGVSRRVAIEVANLHDYCSEYRFYICSEKGELAQIVEHPLTAIVVISSSKSEKMDNYCIDKIENMECLSISRRGYMLFFHDPSLPIQHFML